MIISCINCYKKFEINDELIPKNGRLLQCSSCNHKWFFKNGTVSTTPHSIKSENIEESENIKIDHKENLPSEEINEEKQIFINNDKDPDKLESLKKVKNKNINIFNIIVVFLISFIAVIILMDTFINPISKIFPNAEIILYNLYESIKDIILFFKDLI